MTGGDIAPPWGPVAGYLCGAWPDRCPSVVPDPSGVDLPYRGVSVSSHTARSGVKHGVEYALYVDPKRHLLHSGYCGS